MWKDTLDLISNYYSKNERIKILNYLEEIIDEYGKDNVVITREVKDTSTYTLYDRDDATTFNVDGVQITTTSVNFNIPQRVLNDKNMGSNPSHITSVNLSKIQYMSSSNMYRDTLDIKATIKRDDGIGEPLYFNSNLSLNVMQYDLIYCSMEILKTICDIVSSSIECSFNQYAYE